jgi:hypothetical protein
VAGQGGDAYAQVAVQEERAHLARGSQVQEPRNPLEKWTRIMECTAPSWRILVGGSSVYRRACITGPIARRPHGTCSSWERGDNGPGTQSAARIIAGYDGEGGFRLRRGVGGTPRRGGSGYDGGVPAKTGRGGYPYSRT